MYIPRRTIEDKPKIIVFSGAGLDAPSGIRTFRDANGLWNEHMVADVCKQTSWKENYNLVHDFYNERRGELKDKEVNHAHKIIQKIYEEYENDVLNITMNVSDFFERLEVPVLHLHGHLKKMECVSCGNTWDIGYKEWDVNIDKCPNCNSKEDVKPAVVFFGGSAGMYTYLHRAMEHTINKNTIVIVIGTQGSVVNIEKYLTNTHCKKILCNLEETSEIDVTKIEFDKVYYESIETAIDKIYKDIKEWL